MKRCIVPLLALMLSVSAASAQAETLIKSAVLKVERQEPLPLSRLDLPKEDEGFAGGRRATADNSTTGRFTGQTFETVEVTATPEEMTAALDQLIADGIHHIVTIADADDLLALADHVKGKDALLYNASALDDRLRTEECRANVIHIAPSRAMLADGLAQYLRWKQWDELLLVAGSHEADQLKAESFRRAARKFGLEIVEEKVFEDTGGARRTDSGHVLVQRQIPVFMQDLEDHDVVVVADESQVFGAYIPYRTWEPRPVVGDAGLIARTWTPAHEGWGATQLQRRFERDQGRTMTDLDYQVWVAIRVVGEAATRAKEPSFSAMRDHLLSDQFEIAAFKGQKLNFRPWNQQLRQGVLLSDGKLVVSVSPQDGFLHQVTALDTLGYDEPESTCELN